MEKVKKSTVLASKISTMEYGDTISHREIEDLIGIRYGTTRYSSVVESAKKEALSVGKMFESVRGYGYRIINPDEYSKTAAKKIISGGRRISAGKRMLDYAPVNQMSEDGRKMYTDVYDRTRILEAAVAGAATEVRLLANNRRPNPLLVESTSSYRS